MSEAKAQPPRRIGCGQCGKPAINDVSGVPLCVDCYYRFTVAQTLQFRMNAAMANHAMDQMDEISGLPSGGRIVLPPIPQPPFTLNNIKLDNSVVGAINTGTVKTIDVNLTHLHNAGNDRAGDALAQLTEAILSSNMLDPKQKNEMAELVAARPTPGPRATPKGAGGNAAQECKNVGRRP
jgi:hypothetical protein